MACTTVPEGNGQSPEQDTDRVPVAGDGMCDAAPVQDIVGRQRSDAVGAEAMRRSRARTLRWIEPDSMYTQDYREDRLNIHVDARGRIERLRCG
jgi:hypothetical protein